MNTSLEGTDRIKRDMVANLKFSALWFYRS